MKLNFKDEQGKFYDPNKKFGGIDKEDVLIYDNVT